MPHLSLTRVILYVQNIGQMQDFYRRHFCALVIEVVEDDWMLLDLGGIELGLHRAGTAPPELPAALSRGEQVPVKMVFTIDEAVELHRERMLADARDVDSIKRYPGFPYAMYDGRDPEGNVFQVMQYD